MIDLKAVLDRLRFIIVTLNQLAAAAVAHAGHLGRHSHQMVAGSAVLADAAAAHALHDRLIGDLNGDYVVKPDPGLLQRLSLSDGAGHAVQDIAVLAVILVQPVMDDADDDLIGDQLAGLHVGFRLLAGGGAVFHGGPEDVASGDCGDIQHFAQALSLCALAGAGGA